MNPSALDTTHVHLDIEHIAAASDSFWMRLNQLLDAISACPPGKGRKMWIASAAGITRPAVQGWEKGRKPRSANIYQLCDHLLQNFDLPFSRLQLKHFLSNAGPDINIIEEMGEEGLSGQSQALVYVAVNAVMEQQMLAPAHEINQRTWTAVALRVGRFYALRQSKKEEVDSSSLQRVARAYLALAMEGAI